LKKNYSFLKKDTMQGVSTHKAPDIDFTTLKGLSGLNGFLLKLLRVRYEWNEEDLKEIYIFGGSVRDVLNKVTPKDIDVRMSQKLFDRFNEVVKMMAYSIPGWKYDLKISLCGGGADYRSATLEIPGMLPFDITIGDKIAPDMSVNCLSLSGKPSEYKLGAFSYLVEDSLETILDDIREKKIRTYTLPDNFYERAKRISRVQKMLNRGYTLVEDDQMISKFGPFEEEEVCPICQCQEKKGEKPFRPCSCNTPYHMSCIEKMLKHNDGYPVKCAICRK
jgi:hypothetical protein